MAKILVVDDEESIRITFETFLRDEGHTVVCAGNCREASRQLTETEFDLIFADIIMEDGSGMEVLRDVRKRGFNSPVIMITGFPSFDTALEAVRLGAFDYLTKPVTQRTLLDATQAALRHKSSRDSEAKRCSNLENIINSIKDLIIAVDDTLTVTEINDEAVRKIELGRTMIGMPFGCLPGICNGESLEMVKETVRTGRPIKERFVACQLGEGPKCRLALTTYPLLDHRGNLSGVVMLAKEGTGGTPG